LVALSYAILWQTNFWERPLPPWRAALSMVCFLLAGALSWTATRSLGRQWRIDAALNEDHELITTGPYRVVRHPIYASMLCLLCASGFVLAPLPLLLAAVIVLILGTEVRVHIEDRLLEERFGERARQYRNRVSAYIPFIR
jgi:protein-S-isoprenylcysteine O-methyltransferase Ste14